MRSVSRKGLPGGWAETSGQSKENHAQHGEASYTYVAGVGFICWFDACLCGAAVFGCEPNLVIDACQH